MKVNEIRVERTYNLGNFESTKIGLSVGPEPNDQEDKQWKDVVDDIAAELKKKIQEIRDRINEKV